MNEEFLGDEFLLLMGSTLVAIAGAATWYFPVVRVARLGRRQNDRLLLILFPFVCLGLIWVVLKRFAAGDVRNSAGYITLFLVTGAAWLAIARWLCSLLGVCLRADVLDRDNPAAAVVVCGALVAVTFIFAGGNIGEGPTVWTTIFPALIATTGLFALWLALELMFRVSASVTEDRDVASAARLAGFLISVGLILGRAVAGDWESTAATLHDFVHDGWPAVLWLPAAVVAEAVLRPSPQRPAPSVARCGVVPALAYLAAATGYVWRLGPWNAGPK